MNSARLACTALVGSALLLPGAGEAQGTPDDYRRAHGLRERFQSAAVDVPGTPSWIGETSRFWYGKSVAGGYQFVRVDAQTLDRGPAFDHARLAAALSAATGEHYTALELPFRSFEYADGERAITVTAEGARWRCELTGYTCERTPARRTETSSDPDAPVEPRRSPDGKWEALIVNSNVHVRDLATDSLISLSVDGSEGDPYQARSLQWSPDSRRLLAYRVRPGHERLVHYIDTTPDDQLQPKHFTRRYAKPGDVLSVQRPAVFDVQTRQQRVIDNSLFPNPYNLSNFRWRESGRAFTFEYNQRGHQVYRVLEVDAATGRVRALISEEPETFFYYRDSDEQGKRFRHDVADGREIIWMSERDGWNHLYLYDGAAAKVKRQITRGPWVVRDVDWVDEQKRQIWFQASGMHPGRDPYFVHHYRINFDGTGLTALTEEDANHAVVYSPSREYYVQTWSRVDQAPVSVLRRTRDRQVLLELERPDIDRLLAAGWQVPEPFVAKGRDGKTDIHGIIIRPTNFDPSKRYPVIEYIYAGPQYSFVPKSFFAYSAMQAQAELGFIVVQIDGMGTSNRSKAFHDVAWKNLHDAGFPDRILWHQAVAAKYLYYDIDRVGIYGTSAGGQSAMGALLFHPDFYDAAVAASACHDNRMDKIWWNELWMGWPLGPHYSAASNVDNAHRLQGELLLVVGELDTNVDPASTYQVVDALIRADKHFDLLVLPGQGHTAGGDYGERRRFDFFVEHLLGVRPPNRNRTPAISGAEATLAR